MRHREPRRFFVYNVRDFNGQCRLRAYAVNDLDHFTGDEPPKRLRCEFIGITIATSAAKAMQAVAESLSKETNHAPR